MHLQSSEASCASPSRWKGAETVVPKMRLIERDERAEGTWIINKPSLHKHFPGPTKGTKKVKIKRWQEALHMQVLYDQFIQLPLLLSYWLNRSQLCFGGIKEKLNKTFGRIKWPWAIGKWHCLLDNQFSKNIVKMITYRAALSCYDNKRGTVKSIKDINTTSFLEFPLHKPCPIDICQKL